MIFFTGISIFFSNAHALHDNQQLIREERRIQITAINDTNIEAQLIDVLKNNSSQPQVFTYHYPLPGHTKNVEFFFDAMGTPFEVLEGNERLNALFDQAVAKNDSRFFRLGSPIYGKLFRSDSLTINPGESVRIKLSWEMSSEFVNDFHFLEIFTEDEIPTEFFEIIYSLATQNLIQHFFTNITTDPIIERDKHQIVLLSQEKNAPASDNLRIFWSHIETPTLEYLTDQTIYYGHFKAWDRVRRPEKIIFLIDTSGSMSENIWNQTLGYLKFLLEKLEGTEVKILFAEEEVRPYKETFEENNRAFLKDFMEHTDSMRPTGKTDINTHLLSLTEEVWNATKEQRAIIVITDQILKLPEDQELISAPVITLHFTDETEGNPGLLSAFTDGFSQRLFRSANALVEANELWSKWQHWTHPIQRTDVIKKEGENEILPEKFTGKFAQESPLFIGRKFDSFETKYTPAAEFLTRRWGALKIAETLKKDPKSQDFEAIISILKRFGIQTPYFSNQDTTKEIQNAIEILSTEERLTLAQSLESREPSAPKNTKFYHSIPLNYQSDFVWKSYDFDTRANENNLLKIAPFSLAQRQLFLQFPELLAKAFGVGEQTEFCTLFRCISVRYGYKENPELSDRAFLSDLDPHHWANPYILQLVERGIFKTALNGKIHPDRAIDRGEFLRMAYEIQKQKNQLLNIGQPKGIFTDVENDSEYFEPVGYYASVGVVKGYQDQTFRPYLELTRAEAVKILLSIQGVKPIQLKGQEPIFSDSTAWEQPWVEEAYHRGWVKGFSDGTFRPRETITRASATRLLVETLLNQ